MAKKKKSGSHNHLSAPAVTSTAPTTPTTPTPAPTLATTTTTTTTTTTNDENNTTTSNKLVDLVDKGSTSTASTSTEPLSTEVSTESSTSVSESSTSTVSSTDATIINENIHKEEDEQQQAQSTSTPTDTADTTDTTDTTTTHAEDTTSITSTNSLPFSKPSGFTRRGPKSATLNLSKDAAIVIAARRAVSRANVLDSGMMDSSSLPSSASGTPRRKSLGTDSILLESNDNDNTDDDNNQNNNSNNNNNNNDNNDNNNNNYMDRENYSQNHNKKFSSPNPILRRGSSNSILKTDVVRSSSLPNEGSSRPSSSTRLLEIANLFISSLSKSRRSIEVERNTTEINIVEVKDLSLDSNLNPYCKLVFKDQSYTTKAAITSHNDASPFQWREWTTFDFYNSISTPEQTQNLSIEVFNQDSVIGTTTVDLGTLSINKWVDMWLDLLTDANDATSVCGKIHLKFKRTLFSRNNSTTGSTDDESSNTSSKRSSIMDTSDDGEPEDEKGPPGKLQRSGRQGSMMKKYINLWRNQYPNHEGVQQLNNTTDSAGSAPPSPSPSAGDSDVPPLDPILSAAPTVPALSVTPSTPLNPNPSVPSTPAHSTALKATNNTNPMMATPVSGYAPSPAVTAPSSSSASSTFGLDDDKKHINVGRRGSVRHKAGSAPVLFLKIFLVAFNETKRIDFAGVVGRSELKDAFYKTFPDYPFPDPFPKVYIRDKQAGIFYELENYAEVTEGSVLQLYTAPEQSVLETRISGLQKTLDEVVKRLSSSSSSSSTSAPHELSYPLLKAQASTDFRPISAATTPTVTPAGSAPLSASTASGSPIENTPTPLQSLKTAIKPALTQIDALKRQVATLRQSYRHEHTTAMANLTSTFEHLSSTLKRSLGEHAAHLFKRSQLATRKDKHMTHYQQLTTKLNETETLVNELTQDVVVHKCKPDAAMISTLLSDLENLDKGITDIHDTYEDLERSFKSVWAKELKNVVNEESFFKAAVDDLDDMDEQYDELANTVKTLQQLINVKATLPTKLPEFHVEDLESRSDTVAGLMQEIVSVAPDHEARMKRLEVAEQLRAKHKAVERAKSPIQEFEDSLASKGSSLRKTGGVDELERKRRLRDQEMLKAIANSSST